EQNEWLRLEITKVISRLGLPGSNQSQPLLDLVETAKHMWKEIGNDTTRRLIARSPSLPASTYRVAPLHERWISHYLWTRSTQRLADEKIAIRVGSDKNAARTNSDTNEIDLLAQARGKLIQKMCRWQVCIESNPSSNLLVGALDGVAAQDFLQRRPT